MTRHCFRFTAVVHLSVVLAVLVLVCFDARKAAAPVSARQMTGESRVTFLAVGDIMISRGVARAIARSRDPLVPFRQMEAIFRSTDFNFGNLESPISDNDNILGKGLIFNTKRRDIAGLKAYNFKVLNIANNHALDQGLAGLRHTRDVLAENDLAHLGVGDNMTEAWQPKTIEVRGVKIGFVGASYSSINDNGTTVNDYVARIEDTQRLAASIGELKRGGTDFIVATMHAGAEYTRRPNRAQIEFAYRAIDLGADIVIGSHPHWVQTIEKYKGKYIFYSLGNFIFDQEWSRDTKEGLALKITLKGQKGADIKPSVEQIELIPVVLENYSTPRPATEAESQSILAKIGENSRFIRSSNGTLAALR